MDTLIPIMQETRKHLANTKNRLARSFDRHTFTSASNKREKQQERDEAIARYNKSHAEFDRAKNHRRHLQAVLDGYDASIGGCDFSSRLIFPVLRSHLMVAMLL